MPKRFEIPGIPTIDASGGASQRQANLAKSSRAYKRQEQAPLEPIVIEEDPLGPLSKVLYELTPATLRKHGFDIHDIDDVAEALASGRISRITLRDGTIINSLQDIKEYITSKLEASRKNKKRGR